MLALRELEDRSYAEIGELVGLKENAVAQLISRARQRLREELRLVEVDRSKLPEECQALLPLLSSYLDGQLKRRRGRADARALESCEFCQKALTEMREASRLYRALIPIPFPELFERIDDALAANGFWDPTQRRYVASPGARRAWLAVGGVVGNHSRSFWPCAHFLPTDSSPPRHGGCLNGPGRRTPPRLVLLRPGNGPPRGDEPEPARRSPTP